MMPSIELARFIHTIGNKAQERAPSRVFWTEGSYTRQWPEVSDFVARFCTLRDVQKSVTLIIYLGPLPKAHHNLI